MSKDTDKLRTILKQIRDETKHPYELLSNSHTTVGEAANEQAVKQYTHKITRKRQRAKQSRLQKRALKLQSSKNDEPQGLSPRLSRSPGEVLGVGRDDHQERGSDV